MKKSRLLSLFLSLVLMTGLLTTFASASSGSAILDEMDVNAKAAVLVDPNTNEILYEKNAHEKMYPASITKVMTCLLTLEAVDEGKLTLDQVVTASSSIHTGIGEGASTADIKEGEEIRVIDLLYAALIPSANEACNVMAEAVAGGVEGHARHYCYVDILITCVEFARRFHYAVVPWGEVVATFVYAYLHVFAVDYARQEHGFAAPHESVHGLMRIYFVGERVIHQYGFCVDDCRVGE